MALPGLGDEELAELGEQEDVIHDLQPQTEWRFEVAFTEKVEVKLLSGNAEIFGTELALQQTYTFRGVKSAIFTETGCQISSKGLLQSDYIAEETPMAQYMNLHFALQQIRDAGQKGPHVLILGPADSGKTSLARLLSAYTIRSSDHGPVAVNLDTKAGMLAPPATLTAAPIESIVDSETASGWGSAPTNGPMPVPVKLPLVYYYGLEEPATDEASYRGLIGKLALAVTGKLIEDEALRHSGVVIDTPTSLSNSKMQPVVDHVVTELGVTVIVVIGNERLYGDMSRRYPNQTVVKVDRSGGTVEKDDTYEQRCRQEQVNEYFYGDSRIPLSPNSTFIDWAELAIYKVKSPGQAGIDSSFLPGGAISGHDANAQAVLELVQTPTPELQGALPAIVDSDPAASLSDIRFAAVLGFVHVADVDDKKARLKILTPTSGRLPRRTLLWGAWPEHVELNSAAGW